MINFGNGKWYSFVYRHLQNDGDNRNAALYTFHYSLINENILPLLQNNNNKWKKISNVGVDTAQMVICDLKHFRNDSDVEKNGSLSVIVEKFIQVMLGIIWFVLP